MDVRLLEYCVRNDLNETAPRAMAVLDPVKVVLTNYEEGRTEDCVIENHPEESGDGHAYRAASTREIYIEREDFMDRRAEEVLPPQAGRRSSPQGRLHHQVRAL